MYLCLCELQLLRELLALLTDDVVIPIERMLQLQQLRWRERCPYAFRLAEWLKKEARRCHFIACMRVNPVRAFIIAWPIEYSRIRDTTVWNE